MRDLALNCSVIEVLVNFPLQVERTLFGAYIHSVERILIKQEVELHIERWNNWSFYGCYIQPLYVNNGKPTNFASMQPFCLSLKKVRMIERKNTHFHCWTLGSNEQSNSAIKHFFIRAFTTNTQVDMCTLAVQFSSER